MAKFYCLWFSCFFFLFCTAFSEETNTAQEERKVYIVYMGAIPDTEYSLSEHHASLLQEVVDGSSPEQYLVRSYTRSFNGFAANLTEQEYQKLAAHKEVVSVFPSRTLQLLTTESWDFTGFALNVSRNLTMENDVIIGLIDSGIWPESESFIDHGIGPIPERWNGTCKGGKDFKCNRKIIGARYYSRSEDTARDDVGHGSHTASIAAGNIVPNTSFYGIATGSVRGGVPSARIAVYKVCSSAGCSEQDIMAGFDDAIADGVDILSISIGRSDVISIQNDCIAIGSLHAAMKGILTVNSAGNAGFEPGKTTSVVPWLFSVAASSTKRQIISEVSLGNGKKLMGRAINSFDLNGTYFPLIYGADASKKQCNETEAKRCNLYCLDEKKIKGKIVICRGSGDILAASAAGALGSIGKAYTSTDVAFVVPFPASILSSESFERLEKYYNSTVNPQASILHSQPIVNKTAPVVASFSSRGPNQMFEKLLKPDITAPGVNILAAFSPATPPSFSSMDKRSVNYSFLTGTSMSCPHVSGAAGYVKSWHPDWSPSAIKSALMTTAWRMNASDTIYGDEAFSYGAGHFDPVKAINPGLVYETTKEDYLLLICSTLKLDHDALKKMFGEDTTCPDGYDTFNPSDFNYPSMNYFMGLMDTFNVTFKRTVTNVGIANSTYKAITMDCPNCKINVNPEVLSFKALKEKKSFEVSIHGRGPFKDQLSAFFAWTDGVHFVRSTIVIYTRKYNTVKQSSTIQSSLIHNINW